MYHVHTDGAGGTGDPQKAQDLLSISCFTQPFKPFYAAAKGAWEEACVWPPRWQSNILQGHEQTLSFHVGKGKVDAAWKHTETQAHSRRSLTYNTNMKFKNAQTFKLILVKTQTCSTGEFHVCVEFSILCNQFSYKKLPVWVLTMLSDPYFDTLLKGRLRFNRRSGGSGWTQV